MVRLHELARYGWDVGALRGYGLTVHQLRRLLEAERWWARWYGQPTALPRAPRLRGRVRAVQNVQTVGAVEKFRAGDLETGGPPSRA